MATLKTGTLVRRCFSNTHRPGEYGVITEHLYSTTLCTMYRIRRESDGKESRWSDMFFNVVEEPALPDDSNPKDAVAQLKVDLSLIPEVFSAHVADALMDGAKKYGPYNWRDKKVQARVYVAAAKRHLAAWFANEETAEDSGVHHLGHAAACLAIILDAQHHECLLDNRPDNNGKRMQDLFDQINQRRAPNNID